MCLTSGAFVVFHFVDLELNGLPCCFILVSFYQLLTDVHIDTELQKLIRWLAYLLLLTKDLINQILSTVTMLFDRD